MTNANVDYVLDSFALLALFQDEPGADQVDQLLRGAQRGQVYLAMTVINLGEVIYRTIREKGLARADEVLARIEELAIKIVDVDRELALTAAYLKGSHRLAYAGCMVAALAQRVDGTIVTGDPDFHQLESVVSVQWLPAAEAQ